MARGGNLIHSISTVAFVVSGLLFMASPQGSPGLAGLAVQGIGTLQLDPAPIVPLARYPLPHLFLHPENPVMWALLLSLWILLVLDAIGQWVDPSDSDVAQQGPVWPMLSGALILAAIWPWLLEPLPWLAAAAAVAMAVLAHLATLRAVGQSRPPVGFLAGWCLGLGMAALSALIGGRLGMSMPQTAVLAILPAAGFGMAAQLRLGRSIACSVALIWAFCGVATTTMGVSPMTAIAAILGISAMATVLIRAAS